MESLPNLLNRLVKPSEPDLLVAGCGTRSEIEALKRSGFSGRITGIDPSPDMITLAKEKLKTIEGVTITQGIVSDLPTDQRFDAATLILVLHFLEDQGAKKALLKSISERLKPRAPLILVDIFGD